MSVPISQFIPPFLSILDICTFILYICVSISSFHIRLSIPFFQIPHLYVKKPTLFFSFWLHSVWQSLGPSISLDTVKFHCAYESLLWPWNPFLMCSVTYKLSLFSHSVVSNSLRPHGLQHARLPCPSPSPGAGSNSCPSSQWCHPTISSSVVPFSSCLQSFLVSGSFLRSELFASGGQSIGASAAASVLPMNIQDWFPLDWLVWSPWSSRD